MTKEELMQKWDEERYKASCAAMSSIGCSSDDARATAIRECIEDLRSLDSPTDTERLQNALGTLWDIAHVCEDGLNPIELADWAIGRDLELQAKAKTGTSNELKALPLSQKTVETALKALHAAHRELTDALFDCGLTPEQTAQLDAIRLALDEIEQLKAPVGCIACSGSRVTLVGSSAVPCVFCGTTEAQ